jgi:Domain of unknown function (DUF1830)
MNHKIICFYKNTSNQIQAVRLPNIVGLSLEQIVFPGQRFMFEAIPEAELEITTQNKIGSTVTEKIICSQIRVNSQVTEKLLN